MGGFAGLSQDQLLALGGNIFIAIVILIVSHFVAKAVKWAIAKAVDRVGFFPRRENVAGAGSQPPTKVGERVGEVAYWLVWLLGFMVAAKVLEFGGLLDLSPIVSPLNSLVDGFVTFVPRVVGAALIFFIGFALATIVRRIVEAAVQAMELDRRLVDAGLTRTLRGPGLARLLGILVFTLIIIPVATAALQVLNITAISDPAIRMLNDIFRAIPHVIGAALIIFIAYLVGRWIGALAEEGLQSMGFDDAIRSIGATEPVRMGLKRSDPLAGGESIRMETGAFPPSRVVGVAILASIVLLASIEAARMLQFAAVAAMLGNVLELASRVLFGAVIIAVGVLIANILSAATARRGDPSAEIMSILVRWGFIALSAAVGLRFMGLANDIIVLAFGLALGSVAVAVAIAFGIGGRDAAKRILDRWTNPER
jgi:hypothetical protein